MAINQGDIINEICGNCRGIRNCEVLHSKIVQWSDVLDGCHAMNGEDIFTMLQCRGCDKVFMVHEYWNSEDVDPDTFEPIRYKDHYPHLKKRIPPKYINYFKCVDMNIWLFDNFVERITGEICKAIDYDLPGLAAMGIRALLDDVMNKTVGDIGGFERKICAMLDSGYISIKQKEVLLDVLELGHAATHRGYTPDIKDVEIAFDIIENIVDIILHSDSRSKHLKKIIPERKTSKDTTTTS